jgi:hypothetical protein
MKRIAAVMMLLGVGCAVNTEDGVSTGTEEELTASASCSTSHNNINYLLDVKKAQSAVGYLNFDFQGWKNTAHNNAVVTLKHRDGSWVVFKTDDNIVDRMPTNATLHYVSSSKGASTAVGHGDSMEVTGVFDIPNSPDYQCKATLTNLCGERNSACTENADCCGGLCESNCPYYGCGHSCR